MGVYLDWKFCKVQAQFKLVTTVPVASGTKISIIITEPTHPEPNLMNQIKETKSLQSNLPNHIQPANYTKENLVKSNLQNKTTKLNQIC